MRARDVRAVVMSLMREADRRWRREGYDWHPGARVVDCFYDTIMSVPTPRRVLEGLASIGLLRLAQIHGVAPADDL